MKKCKCCGVEKTLNKFGRSLGGVKKDRWYYKGKCSSCTNRKQAYNVSYDDLAMLVRKTSCDACEKDLDGRFVIDHCHSTGEVRGVLCGGCNLALGHVKDDVNTLLNLIKYLNK